MSAVVKSLKEMYTIAEGVTAKSSSLRNNNNVSNVSNY
jgi:hypothetical protein